MGMQIEQRSARVGSATIYYQAAGAGEALVLLHGLSGSARWWAKNIPALAQYYHVYVVDLIGFGRSRGQRFVLDQAADIIEAWMEQVDETCFNFIGHSMGGLVAAEIAARDPRQIDRLVLVDAAALPMGHTVLRSAWNLARALPDIPLDFLPVLVTDALRAGPLTLLRATYAIHQADITADLARIAARTLIVWGQHDTLLPTTRGEQLHRALPGSEFVVIPRAGHNPMWDQPEVFNRVVLSFLRERGSPEQ